jgi:hypothetical protein
VISFASPLTQSRPLVCRSSPANGAAYPIACLNHPNARTFALLDGPLPRSRTHITSLSPTEKPPPLVPGRRRRAQIPIVAAAA